jgi:hypothetical protein
MARTDVASHSNRDASSSSVIQICGMRFNHPVRHHISQIS